MKWKVGLATLCVRRLPEYGTLVPKHVWVMILVMNSLMICILLHCC